MTETDSSQQSPVRPARQRHSGTAYDLLLLLAAAIWGFAFVAQRVGMEHMGPFTFSGIRFMLGAVTLIPVILWRKRTGADSAQDEGSGRLLLWGGLLVGLLVFLAAGLQQVGLLTTTAGNAGFITGLYLVLVPVFGRVIGQRTGAGTVFGVLLAIAGLYLLSFSDMTALCQGDLLILCGTVFWAVQILALGWLSPRLDPFKLAFLEFAFCSLFSTTVAVATETISWNGVAAGVVPLLYGGVASVGVAYTLQVVAQKRATASHGAILMSLEAVFAMLGGMLLLGEALSARSAAGCGLMLAGMMVSSMTQKPSG